MSNCRGYIFTVQYREQKERDANRRHRIKKMIRRKKQIARRVRVKG